MIQKRTLLSMLAALFFIIIAGCLVHTMRNGKEASASRQMFAMDTVISLEAHGKHAEQAVDEAAAELLRLDAMFSTGNAESEISMLNRLGEGEVSDETLAVIWEGLRIYSETDGMFDLTIYPLMRLWGFTDGQYRIPSETELEVVLPFIDAGRIEISGNYVKLGEGQEIDLGGIAKGYASARLMDIYRKHGIKSGLVSLGGNVQTLGLKPDGSKWKIGVRAPEKGQEQQVLAVIRTADRAVITSGGYERYFEEGENTYIHIIDPKTGFPADGELLSVTILSEDGMMADALSTALYLMGYEKACHYWRNHNEAFDMVLVAEDGKIFVTETIAEDFSTEEEYEIIKLR